MMRVRLTGRYQVLWGTRYWNPYPTLTMDPNSHPNHKTNQPPSQLTKQPIHLTNQPNNLPINQPNNQPANYPPNQPTLNTPPVLRGGGEGCHLRVVPPGQLLRRPSTPKPFIKPGFSIFLT